MLYIMTGKIYLTQRQGELTLKCINEKWYGSKKN